MFPKGAMRIAQSFCTPKALCMDSDLCQAIKIAAQKTASVGLHEQLQLAASAIAACSELCSDVLKRYLCQRSLVRMELFWLWLSSPDIYR